ncbi:MAG: NifU family protein [Alphaproteobacteria bacterium]|nr:NifU family protein [Alphaproteobacteria bacterium]
MRASDRNLADKVIAALQASVLPSVIARGGEIRVRSIENGMVTLETSGSPGAALPLSARIEAAVRQAVPDVEQVRILGPGVQPARSAGGGLAARVREVLDRDINPIVAAHRGHVILVAVEEGWARIRLEGGCQGCSLAEVTLRQGIEPLLRARVPEIVGLADVTDHEAGREPFYSAAKR